MVEPSQLSSSADPPSDTRPSRRRISSLILALLGLIVLCAIGIFGYVTESGIKSSRAWVLHTYDVRSELQNLETQLAEARANALGYASSGDENQLKDFRTHSANIERVLQNLRALTADNERQQHRLAEMEGLSRKYISEIESVATVAAPRVARNSTEPNPIRSLEARESEQKELVRAMDDDEQLLLKGRLTTWDHFFLRNTFILTITLAVAVIFLVFNFRFLSREISRTRQLERMQRENARSARALSSRVLELQDAERRKVARELHDSVGQYLVGIKINLEQLLTTNTGLSPGNMKLLNDTIDLTERSLVEVRTISHLLHPPLLDEVGLESAARWYVDGFAKRSGLKVNLQLVRIANRFPKEVELALFRVLQESLTNVHRHANATSIEIVLACHDGSVTLAVQDDGNGISRDILKRYRSGLASGVGLAGMRERLAELDGILEVEARSRGTVVKATIPAAECQLQPDPLQTTPV
jgi:signal transduction histidine kinase